MVENWIPLQYLLIHTILALILTEKFLKKQVTKYL